MYCVITDNIQFNTKDEKNNLGKEKSVKGCVIRDMSKILPSQTKIEVIL